MGRVMQQVACGEDCYRCGAELVIHTKADQRHAEENGSDWWAWEKDEVYCPQCGLVGAVSVYEGCGHINQAE